MKQALINAALTIAFCLLFLAGPILDTFVWRV
jgi:hypothetical protein